MLRPNTDQRVGMPYSRRRIWKTASSLLAMGDGGACPAPPTQATSCMIDNVLASNGQPAGSGKSGYSFTYTVTATNGLNTGYAINANPITNNQTGVRSFCSVANSVIRYKPAAADWLARTRSRRCCKDFDFGIALGEGAKPGGIGIPMPPCFVFLLRAARRRTTRL